MENELIKQVTALDLRLGEHVVVGSASLSIRGIREHKDIDLIVSDRAWSKLLTNGWRHDSNPKKPTNILHPKGNIEADKTMNWLNMDTPPTVKSLIENADVIASVPFMSLSDLRTVKVVMGRPKDLTDIKLIDAYQAHCD